jgi:hypothetical protein
MSDLGEVAVEEPARLLLSDNQKAQREKIRDVLLTHEIGEVVVEVDGYGDEGEVNDIAFRDQSNNDTTIPDEDWLEDETRDLFYSLAQSMIPGFDDNEGGGGSFVWIIATDEISFDGGYYERVRDDYVWKM